MLKTDNGKPLPPQGHGDEMGAFVLLQLESDARRKTSERELIFHIVNESRKAIPFRQAILIRRIDNGHSFRVESISSIAVVDRNVPVVRWMERMTARLSREVEIDTIKEYSIPAFCDESDTEAKTYPFPYFLWVPMKLVNGSAFAGLLLARDKPWQEKNLVVAERLGETYAHAWGALVGTKRLHQSSKISRSLLVLFLVALVAGFFRIPMSTLAPVEVVADSPYIFASPIKGVIKEILVDPNTPVKIGDLLVSYVDTKFRNEYELAERGVQVAESRFRRASLESFRDSRSKREIAVTQAELALAKAERDYARDRLKNVELFSDKDGIVIYTDKRDWAGRPVAIGEQIMYIAQPDQIEFKIKVPIGDSIILKEGARIKIFLDADPLNPEEAVITSASYHAEPGPGEVMEYLVRGRMLDMDQNLPRIGARGTAQIFGEEVSLYFYIFRRPIAAIRQFLGL